MIETLRIIFAPLQVIARELTHIRKLYEQELLSRTNPVYLFTEEPKETDTVVSYMGEHQTVPKHKRWNLFADEDL